MAEYLLRALDIKKYFAGVKALDGVSLDNVTNRLQMAGLDRWVERLKEANEKFITFFTNRNNQQATIIAGATKAARLETDAAYRAAVTRLNALAEVNGDTDAYSKLYGEI